MARFVLYFLIFLCAFCRSSISEEYQLPPNTDVTFKYSVAGLPFEGKFKVTESKFDINFKNPVQSGFFVKFDLMESNAGFPLATTAMKQVLDAYKFPNATFESKSVQFSDKNLSFKDF
jgi:polyisoprenoid-binding protein YceI